MSRSAEDRLIVMLEARVTEFEKRMTRADRLAQRRMRNVESNANRMQQRVDASLARAGRAGFTAIARYATMALAPILSVRAAINTATTALREFDTLGNRARMFGVDVESLQELRFAAEQSGMAVDNFDTALRRFIRRSAEAAQGTGAAKNAFKELGVELHDNEGRLRRSEDLLRDVADALQRVPNQADRLRLAFRMFDTDGAAMVNVLSQGSAGLDEFAQKARDLGLVVDRHMIARAQELKTEFDTATRVLNQNFQQALVDIAPILISTARLVGGVAQAINGVVDAMRSVENMTGGGLNARRSELQGLLEEERRQITALRERGPIHWNQGDQNLMENALEREASLQAQIRRVENQIFRRANEQSMRSFTPDVLGELDDVPPEADTSAGTSSSRVAAADAAVRQAEAVKQLIDNMRHEQEQLGRTAEEQELYNLLKSVAVERESEFGREVEAVLGPLQEQRAAIQANAEAIQALEDASKQAMRTFIDDMIAGKSAAEALANALSNIGNRLIDFGLGAAFGKLTVFQRRSDA